MMKQWSVFLTSLILVSQSWAAPQGNGYRSESDLGTECIECQNSGGDSALSALMRFSQNMNAITDGVLDIEIISDKFNYADKCDKFAANENGELNKWGSVITREISKPRCATMLNQGPRDIKTYCPNFTSMNTIDKKALYVLIMAAMTHYESSCNFREKAPGPNGTAAGLLQLHKGKEQKYSSGCRKNDSLDAERSLSCGVAMVCDQTSARGENLFSSGSYWEVLRPRGRSQKAKKIMAAIRKFGPCDPKSNTTANAKRKIGTKVAQK
jgi:hypothetical protein